MVGLVKGAWDWFDWLIWPCLIVLYTRALNLSLLNCVAWNCLWIFLSLAPPGALSTLPKWCVLHKWCYLGRFASWLPCRYVQRGRGHKLTSFDPRSRLWRLAPDFFVEHNDPRLDDDRCKRPVRHLPPVIWLRVWNHPLLAGHWFLLYNRGCLQKRAELKA